ncbi:hypothetical protein IT413_05650 [Candidatus Peregrinibacteria bacterium]|nr:hypothetical protein [Candidatus Peregrinibacteria bacterium]
MKRSYLTIFLLGTLALAGCQNQEVPRKPQQPEQVTPQVSANVTGAQTGTQQNISETGTTQQTHLKVEGEKILPTDKPIEVDLSQVYDATANREGSETQAVKP